MRHLSLPIGTFAIACGLLAGVQTALALSPETWVSGIGTDSGPCPRTAPCRTFAFAFTKTSNGGSINVLTPGNFGPLTITKGISIVADNVEAVINTAAGGAAIVVNAGANIVSLRGLTIEGVAGNRGIDFTSGAALHVQNCVIRRANFGIVFSPAAGTRELTVSDTVIANNLTNGINVEPTGSGGAKVVLDRVRLENNGFDGADMSATATTGSVTATVRDSVVAGNSSRGIRITNSGSGTINVMIDRTASVNNNSVGISTSVATIRIGDSIVTGSDFGLFANDGGTIETYGTNKVDGNGTDVDVTGGTITLIPHK